MRTRNRHGLANVHWITRPFGRLKIPQVGFNSRVHALLQLGVASVPRHINKTHEKVIRKIVNFILDFP